MCVGSKEGQWNDTSNHLKLWTYGTCNYYNRMTAQHTSKEQFIKSSKTDTDKEKKNG